MVSDAGCNRLEGIRKTAFNSLAVFEVPLLKNIKVSGFKSLEGFSLEFHKGLNVIVGPNGSGKTNILSFLEFLSHTR